jgi:hypothetical protein
VTVVVDLGCHPLGQDSMEILRERFKPSLLYGFDPNPATRPFTGKVDDTLVVIDRAAAATYDGDAVLFCPVDHDTAITTNPSRAADLEDGGEFCETLTARCFDLSAWLGRLSPDVPPVVMKMDVEGSEYPLLTHLLDTGMIARVGRLLVEWHQLAGWVGKRQAVRDRLRAWPGELDTWA